MAKLIKVIETDVCRGKGTSDDVCRRVMQYWSLSGVLLAECDPLNPGHVLPMQRPDDLVWLERHTAAMAATAAARQRLP